MERGKDLRRKKTKQLNIFKIEELLVKEMFIYKNLIPWMFLYNIICNIMAIIVTMNTSSDVNTSHVKTQSKN